MSSSGERARQLVLLLVCVLPFFGAFHLSDGLFTIDEFIYLISADAMATKGSFTVDNGFSSFASDDLKMWFLVEGPNGLAPQYPPGLALLGSPFYAHFGTRGLIVMNAVAASGVALLTWAIARKLYDSSAVGLVSVLILTFGTFHFDYAMGIWPHMTSTFFVLSAFILALYAIDETSIGRVITFSVLSGLAVGGAMMMRTDGILILPVVGICILMFAARPFLTIIGGAVGLFPGIAVASLINLHKFGTANFLSYGTGGGGGGDDLTTHFEALAVLCVVTGGFVFLRQLRWNKSRASAAVVVAIAAVAALLVVPSSRGILEQLGRGYYALFVDARTIYDPRSGVVLSDDGVLRFWGVAKKALFQSLPWLAVLGLLFVTSWRGERGRAHSVLLVFALVWSLPFAFLTWHGGFSSSMRYFLPLVPALTILGSSLIVEIASRTQKPIWLSSVGVLAAIVFGFATYDKGMYDTDGVSQQVTTLFVFGIVLFSMPLLWVLGRSTRLAHSISLLLVCFGIGFSTFGSLLVDLTYSQSVRAQSNAIGSQLASLEGKVLLYGGPNHFAFAVSREDAIFGISGRLGRQVDADLIVDSLRSGYRAIMPLSDAQEVTEVADVSYTKLFPGLQYVEMFENRADD